MPEILAQIPQALGRTVAETIDLIGRDQNAAALAVALVVAGLAAAVMLVVRTAERVRHVRRAVAAVELTSGASGFARSFDKVSNQIEALRLLRTPWLRFKSTLVRSQTAVADDSAVIQCTGSPAEYFSLAALREGWRDYRALPSLFLSLALLLTVIGVAASLSAASKAFDDSRASAAVGSAIPGSHGTLSSRATAGQPDAPPQGRDSGGTHAPTQTVHFESMQIALRNMLNSGRASFSLAIAGLLISLLLTAALRICSSRLTSAVQVFTAALQDRLVLVSFEAVVLERLASGTAVQAGTEIVPFDAHGRILKVAIEQAVPLNIEAAMARLQAEIERNSAANADASSAAIRGLIDELGRLIDDRVVGPVRGMTDEISNVRGQLTNLADMAVDNMFRVSHSDPSSTAANSSANPSQTGQSKLRRVGFEATALAPQPDLTNEIRNLLAKLEHSNAQIAVVTRSANERLVADIVERLKADIAQPVSSVSKAIGEVRTTLGSVSDAVARVGAVTASGSGNHVQIEQLLAEVARLRQSVEVGNERITSDNRATIHDLKQALVERLNERDHPDPAAIDALSKIESRLDHLDTAVDPDALLKRLNAVVLSAVRGGNEQVVKQHLEGINALAEEFTRRLGGNVGHPIQELAAVVSDMRQTLSAAEADAAQARAHLAGSVSKVAEEVRLATDDLRGAITTMASQAKAEGEIARHTLLEQMRQSVEQLDQAKRQLEQHDSDVTNQLKQALDAASATWSREAETAAAARTMDSAREVVNALAEEFTRRLDGNVGHPIQELAAVVSDMRQTLSAAEADAAQARAHLAGSVSKVAEEARLATDDLRGAITTMASQAKAEGEIARQTLMVHIKHAVENLSQAATQFQQNGSSIANRLTQVIDAAPASLTRGAEAAMRTVQTAAAVARAQLERTAASFAETTARDAAQTTAAVTHVSEQLVRQTTHARGEFRVELASTLAQIKEASTNINQAITDLRGNLSQDTQVPTAEALDDLAAAVVELRAATQRSTDEKVQSVTEIWEAATEARTMIESELAQMRQKAQSEAAQADDAAATRLQEAAAQVASAVACFGGNLSATTDSLVQTVQALSAEMRQLKATIVDQRVSEMEFATPLKLAANDRSRSVGGRHLGPMLYESNPIEVPQPSFEAGVEPRQPSVGQPPPPPRSQCRDGARGA